MIQYGHLVGHVTRHLPPLYYWLSATLSFLSRISNSIPLLPNGQKTALFCVPQDAIYGWHTTSEFLWSSTQFPANIRLSDHYKNLEDFFIDRVGVKRLAWSAVTQPTVQPQASAGDAQYCALLSRVITAARNATLPTFGMDSTERLHNASSHNAGASLNGVGTPEKFPLSRLFTTEKIGVAGELYVSQLCNLERINRWTNDS